MNQPPSPTSARESTGRMEWVTRLPMNSQLQSRGMFICEPPLIGSTGHR